MKISFEIDQSKLFDVVAKYGTEAVLSDILGHLMTGRSGFGAKIRMLTYGIEPLEIIDPLKVEDVTVEIIQNK